MKRSQERDLIGMLDLKDNKFLVVKNKELLLLEPF